MGHPSRYRGAPVSGAGVSLEGRSRHIPFFRNLPHAFAFLSCLTSFCIHRELRCQLVQRPLHVVIRPFPVRPLVGLTACTRRTATRSPHIRSISENHFPSRLGGADNNACLSFDRSLGHICAMSLCWRLTIAAPRCAPGRSRDLKTQGLSSFEFRF